MPTARTFRAFFVYTHINRAFNFMCYAFTSFEMTVTAQTCFNHPIAMANRKLQQLLESSGPFCLLNLKVTGAITFRILQ